MVLGLPLSGSANGNEIITVNAVATSIYDINVLIIPASQSGTNNKANLNQSTGLIITNVAIDTDYTRLTVTFNEAVYNTANGTGNLDIDDFSLSITGTAKFSGGSSGLSTATPTYYRIDDRTLTLEIPSLSAAATGDEIITVNAASASSIYNANGHSAAKSQTGTDNTVSK